MTKTTAKRFSSSDIEIAIERIAEDIANNHRDTAELFFAGIAQGGISVARRLASKVSDQIGRKIPVGIVDVSFHRDDIGAKPIPRITSPTEIPKNIDGGTCILVDDVLFTGRSTRAALNELFDQGRPDRIELAILVDRGGRKLPIQPNYVGFVEKTSNSEDVTVQMDSDDPDDDAVLITTK